VSKIAGFFMSVLALLLVAVLILQAIKVNDYVIAPGDATVVSSRVLVRGLDYNHQPDKILLTDVYLNQLSELQYIWDVYFANTPVYPGTDFTGASNIPISELNDQGFMEMYESKQAAEYEALRTLGWRPSLNAEGATLEAIIEDSPAAEANLSVGDRVQSVNGHATPNACAMIHAMAPIAPGSHVTIGYQPALITDEGVVTFAPATIVKLVTKPAPAHDNVSCAGNVHLRSIIGVGLGDAVNLTVPGSISIDTTNIGGPSAGLAMTLTLINKLSGGSLTGGHVIAATGTIAPNGQVGQVGGVAQKTIAVERTNATIFFVPRAEVSQARSEDNGKLRIFGVTTLRQVLRDLRSLGGARPIPLTKPYPLKAAS